VVNDDVRGQPELERRLMQELVHTLSLAPPENLATLLRKHSVHAGHCDSCHTVWPCTLWAAATAASRRMTAPLP